MFSYMNRGRDFYRNVVTLALPIVLQNLCTTLLGLIDTFMVGSLGEAPLAAVLVANTPVFIIQLVIFGLQSGSSVLISQFWGKGDTDSINRVVGIGFYIAGAIAAVFAGAMFLIPGQIMAVMTDNGELIPLAARYARIVGFSYLFNSMTGVYVGAHRAMENPKLGMAVFGISMLTNAFLNWVLIFGNLGAPALGVEGAAIATIIGQIASFAVSVVYMPRFKSVQLKSDAFRLDRNTCGNIVTFGLSSFITQFAITIVMALTNNLLSFYGAASPYGAEIPLTATGIVMKVNQIMIAILLGIATGTQPIIGFNYGARNYKRVRQALEISLIASEVVSIAAFFIFQFAPMSVISLFGTEDDLYNTFATMAFRIFLMLCPLTGFQTIAAVYLQAVGKPVKSAILSLARQIIFFIHAALILPRFLGVAGVLWTGPVADGLAFILSLFFIIQERTHLKRQHALEAKAE